MTMMKLCPDCGAPIGELHRADCDVERCPHCGWSALGCAHFHGDDPRRQVWNGKRLGEDDCERLGFYSNGDPDFPDLNRLFSRLRCDAVTVPLGTETVSAAQRLRSLERQ